MLLLVVTANSMSTEILSIGGPGPGGTFGPPLSGVVVVKNPGEDGVDESR